MTKKKRNHADEYRRRIERGRAKGLSRSEARGHPRAGERSRKPKLPTRDDRKRFDNAVGLLRKGQTLTTAAKASKVSPERLRAFIKANDLARKEGGRWAATPKVQWRMPIIVGAETRAIVVPYRTDASDIGRFHNAIKRAVDTGDPDHLTPFKGKRVIDASGRSYAYETDLNELYRYAAKDEPQFHEIYQQISN